MDGLRRPAIIDAHQHFWDRHARQARGVPGRSRPCRSATETRGRSDGPTCRLTTAPTLVATGSSARSTWRRSGTRPTRSARRAGSRSSPRGRASPAPWSLRRGSTATTWRTCWRARPPARSSAASVTSPGPRRPRTPSSRARWGRWATPRWRAGFARLARHGLSFDLQTPWWHLREAAALARAFPDTLIVLNHTGLPADRSPEGLRGWREAMATLAVAPNVAVKISGLGVPGPALDGRVESRGGPAHHRALRRRPRDVRLELPGGQPGRELRHDLRGLQDHRARLLRSRTGAASSTTTPSASTASQGSGRSVGIR